MAAQYDLIIEQGAGFVALLHWKPGEVSIDTAGWTAQAMIRADIDDVAAVVEMTTANGRITLGYQPDVWTATTAYVPGQERRPTVDNGFVYRVQVGGVSGGAEPTWPTVVGQEVVDGTVTWVCLATFSVEAQLYNIAIRLSGAESAALTDWGRGVWDLKLIPPGGGEPWRLLYGNAYLWREVSR